MRKVLFLFLILVVFLFVPFQAKAEGLPITYKISIQARNQAYSLSCEFAAAAAILYYYSKDPFFATPNEKQAEELLLEMVPISSDPDLGIRMGLLPFVTKKELLANFSKPIGGVKYYGIHAAPFINLFSEFGLSAVPLDKQNAKEQVKKAIVSRHVVMMWNNNENFGKIQNVDLPSGEIKQLVQGEHAVVIYGYDKKGVYVIDSNGGRKRFISDKEFYKAIGKYDMPLLEVFGAEKTTRAQKPKILGISTRMFTLRNKRRNL